ncbi:la-related protein 7 [Histomonas meleagridis]|uniref:la-related protein 7 n=1 Tax=Histomonas meleagridis TaxID=135588 RepID=UPI003559EF62|nr:la-related protein 7 [Histomonas meleagridis]KAH0799791.1 la-related protein 7 [Histomonas meleagridis]
MFILRKLFGKADPPSSENEEIKQQEVYDLTPELDAAREQMEFYFSPSNVENSSFMKQLINMEADRYCPIQIFNEKFNKIVAMHLTDEELMKACQASSELEVDTSRKMVRSKVPFKPDPRREYRTLYVDQLDQTETLESLQAFFRSLFGKVLRIEMRNKNRSGGEKYFSGTAYVELQTEEQANEAVKNGIEYNGKKLPIKLLSTFKQEMRNKSAERRENKSSREPKKGAKPKRS